MTDEEFAQFLRNGGLAREVSNAHPSPVNNSRDVTANKHRGNAESIAAHRQNQSNAAKQRQRILDLANQKLGYGLTCEEAADALHIPYQSCSARFSELKRDGLLVPSLFTRPTKTGSTARVIVTAKVLA